MFRSDEWETLSPALHFPNHMSPDVSSSTALTLMQQCLNKHSECIRAQPANTFLPTRVIAVGGEGEQKSPYLYESRGEKATYACLSHCWGSSEHLKTTSSTLYIRKKCIPLEDLSQTFRDAIRVTRAFRIPYLWIDSLCIIQDDEADWELESSRMAETYRNAIVTIAATSSPDGTGGLFCVNPEFQKRAKIRVDGNSVFIRKSIDHATELHRRSLRLQDPSNLKQLAAMPLTTRAWAVQERILSTRMVHFTHQGIFWECITHQRHETSSRPSFNGPKREFLNCYFNEWRAEDNYKTRWRMIVAIYTRANLTRESDKLPALSGISGLFQHVLQDSYLAGLWRKSLVFDMAWSHADPGRRVLTRPSVYRAPSWSWASVDGPVHWNKYQMEDPALVISAGVTPKGSNLLGAVTEGFAILYSELVPVELDYLPNTRSAFQYVCKRHGFVEPARVDHPIYERFSQFSTNSTDAVYVLRLFTVIGWPGSPGHTFIALVLRKSDQMTDIYERVGILDYKRLDPSCWFEGVRKQNIKIV